MLGPTLTDLIEDYLLLWILLSVGLGIALPQLAVVTRASTLILAVMIGDISLTLSVEQFRGIDTRTLGFARGFGLSPELMVGFVVLGAVTPELVTPVMTDLAGGDPALSTTALVVIGVGSVGFIPLVVALLASEVDIPRRRSSNSWSWSPSTHGRTSRVSRYDAYYPAIASNSASFVNTSSIFASPSVCSSSARAISTY